MPHYDFTCGACQATFEISRPMSKASDPVHCAVCGSTARRVYSGVPIIWRPDGWNLHPGDPGYSDNLVKETRPVCQQ